MSEIIGGINPVREALRAQGRAVERLYLRRGRLGSAAREIMALARSLGIRVDRVDQARLDHLYGRPGHQGVVAAVGPYGYFSLEEVLARAAGPQALVLVLDGVLDPMNLGSLLRSAEAAGAAGVLVPRDRAAPVSPAAIKASAGAAEYVPLARVVNLARTLERLKEEGFWVVGAHPRAQVSLYDQDLDPRSALVVGGEGRGLRRLVRERCDSLVQIPLAGRISSLNAAVAGALIMFEYVRQRQRARKA